MIYEASFQGLFKVILWMIVISIIIRLVARLALPHVIKKSEQVMRERMQKMQEQQRPQRPEGDVTIESQKRSRPGGNDGDYVDYVELKD